MNRWVGTLFLYFNLILNISAQEWPHSGKYGTGTRYIYIVNNTEKNLLIKFLSGGEAPPKQGEFQLLSGTDSLLEVSNNWTASRIWGLTNEDINGNNARVLTLAEFTFSGWGDQDYYDLSLVDGYNLPAQIQPVPGTFVPNPGEYQCKWAGCIEDLLSTCPGNLQLKTNDGTVYGCMSACEAFQEDQYCCRGTFGCGPECCPPTQYSEIFKAACPTSYSYAYDDVASTFKCATSNNNSIGPDYIVNFGFERAVQILESPKKDFPFEVTPNKMFVLAQKNGKFINYSIQFFNGKGELVKKFKSKNAQFISLKQMNSGIYFLQIQYEDLKWSTRIVIH